MLWLIAHLKYDFCPPRLAHTHSHTRNPPTPPPLALSQDKVASPSSSDPHTYHEESFKPPPMPDSFKSQ